MQQAGLRRFHESPLAIAFCHARGYIRFPATPIPVPSFAQPIHMLRIAVVLDVDKRAAHRINLQPPDVVAPRKIGATAGGASAAIVSAERPSRTSTKIVRLSQVKRSHFKADRMDWRWIVGWPISAVPRVLTATAPVGSTMANKASERRCIVGNRIFLKTTSSKS